MASRRKSLKVTAEDEAVSPVIAVILMVAITVVLAAVVYVWVSGFSVDSNGGARSISVTTQPTANNNATFIVTSASASLRWSEVQATLGGSTLQYANLTASAAGANRWCISYNGICAATQPTGTVNAGDIIIVQNTGTLSGASFALIDTKANALMLQLTTR